MVKHTLSVFSRAFDQQRLSPQMAESWVRCSSV